MFIVSSTSRRKQDWVFGAEHSELAYFGSYPAQEAPGARPPPERNDHVSEDWPSPPKLVTGTGAGDLVVCGRVGRGET